MKSRVRFLKIGQEILTDGVGIRIKRFNKDGSILAEVVSVDDFHSRIGMADWDPFQIGEWLHLEPSGPGYWFIWEPEHRPKFRLSITSHGVVHFSKSKYANITSHSTTDTRRFRLNRPSHKLKGRR